MHRSWTSRQKGSYCRSVQYGNSGITSDKETMSKEIWKQIKDYPKYFVSDMGNVKRNNKILKNWLIGSRSESYKYKAVTLSKDGKIFKFLTHRLVLSAFVENEHNKPFVNHKNGNKLDNRLENLEWVTHKENHSHAAKIGLMERGSRRYNAKLNENDIIKIRNLSGKISHKKIGVMFGISQPIVTRIINKKVWKHVE